METIVRTVAIVATLIIVASFALFARDQFAGASERQRDEVVGVTYSLPNPHRETQPRRFIDSADRKLLEPFTFADTSHSVWAQRTVPTIIGLLLYGLGLGFLARSLHGMRVRGRPSSGAAGL